MNQKCCENCCCLCQTPGKINFAVLASNQSVPNGEKVSLSGSLYQNDITLTPPYILHFPAEGMYKIDFVISTAITQPGPLSFGFMVSSNGSDGFGEFAGGRVDSTTSGLQLSGTGFVNITKAPTTGYLQNNSGQAVQITYLRLNIVKIS